MKIFFAALVFFAAPVLAQKPVAPNAAVQAARAAMSDTVLGNALRIRLLTIGQGDLVFERYGHNLLWITDTRTNESVVWGWGNFDFTEAGFYTRFLFGTGMYMITGENAAAVLNFYLQEKRVVESQELALTAGQRAALYAFVHTNALQENRLYRYDYFLDNCSTRLRDALDIVLDGAISSALVPRSSNITFRSETLRLNQHSNILFMGLDLALGAPADAPLSPWFYSFVPMRLRDELQTVRVPGPDGSLVPLASVPQKLINVERAADPAVIDSREVRAIIVVGALFIALLALGLSGPAERGSAGAFAALASLGTMLHLVIGLLATLIVFMWAFTFHAFWAWNQHLLLFTPLSLVIAALIPFTRRRPGIRSLVQQYHFFIAGVALLVSLYALISTGGGVDPEADMLFAWASASWLVHLTIGFAIFRAGRSPAAPERGPVTAKIAA